MFSTSYRPRRIFRLLPAWVLFVLLQGCSGPGMPEGAAPDIRLVDLDGKEFHLAEELGKGPILVDFWATWCAPCRRAMPHYQKLVETFGDAGFRVLAISEDKAESEGKVRRYIASESFDFTVLLDPTEAVRRAWGVETLPHSFLLDRNGTVVHEARGFADGEETLLAATIDSLLRAAPQP